MERKSLRYRVEVHKKYAIPVACLIFVLLGAPLAVGSGRGGATMVSWETAFPEAE